MTGVQTCALPIYHGLFLKENFKDFLLVNEFDVEVVDDFLFKNHLASTTDSASKTSWSNYYFGEKIEESDFYKYHKIGDYFFDKKDGEIRLKPIEAIEFYRKAYSIKPQDIDNKLSFVHSLLYRAIYNDPDEFIEILMDIFNKRETADPKCVFKILEFYFESQKYNFEILKKAQVNSLMEFLYNSKNEGKVYLESLFNMIKNNQR